MAALLRSKLLSRSCSPNAQTLIVAQRPRQSLLCPDAVLKCSCTTWCSRNLWDLTTGLLCSATAVPIIGTYFECVHPYPSVGCPEAMPRHSCSPIESLSESPRSNADCGYITLSNAEPRMQPH
eukprot:126297-Pelagomonas_calceolata.AAC.8